MKCRVNTVRVMEVVLRLSCRNELTNMIIDCVKKSLENRKKCESKRMRLSKEALGGAKNSRSRHMEAEMHFLFHFPYSPIQVQGRII